VIGIEMAAIAAGVAVMEAEEAEDTTTVEVNIVLQFQFNTLQSIPKSF
jgi:hypothetical protein